MLIKKRGQKHFTRRFGTRSFSHRVIVPGRDFACVKVTEFFGAKGDSFQDISYPYDETVRVLKGQAKITLPDGSVHKVSRGFTFYVAAGESYSLEITRDLEAVCFFSSSVNGVCPPNEDPERD